MTLRTVLTRRLSASGRRSPCRTGLLRASSWRGPGSPWWSSTFPSRASSRLHRCLCRQRRRCWALLSIKTLKNYNRERCVWSVEAKKLFELLPLSCVSRCSYRALFRRLLKFKRFKNFKSVSSHRCYTNFIRLEVYLSTQQTATVPHSLAQLRLGGRQRYSRCRHEYFSFGLFGSAISVLSSRSSKKNPQTSFSSFLLNQR